VSKPARSGRPGRPGRSRPVPAGAGAARPKPIPGVATTREVGTNKWAASSLEEQKRRMLESREKIKNRREPRAAALKATKFKKRAGAVGLAALGTLGGIYGIRKGMDLAGVSQDALMKKALLEMVNQEKQDEIQGLVGRAQAQSYENAIQQNLGRVQQYAPDLFMSVAAGRKLPSGAVVLGGTPRQDLLNELGRAMADGRFSR
jgi:hypothetical protein